ncbi:MAG: 4Fe-4S dicluster domain-containing protein [Firmicutes bacterium]|jgi:PAS domain S-box-containing protein|nr:4Fe-4S dicluster domain-containing protein [Bacillota bacterium]
MEYKFNIKELRSNPNVIYTEFANCQDCHRCIRACPVKAIRVSGGQARVTDELCVHCGTCVKECPQHAKVIAPSLLRVKKLIEENERVAVSIAPSFASLFSGWSAKRLPAALRLLGFSYVSETAEGAQLVSEDTLHLLDKGNIATACPAAVNYIEKYKPELIPQLLPIVSPMVAHGRILKKRLGEDTKVVFIGPCAAKKQEALRPELSDAVDEVLTFVELMDWLQEEEVNVASCPESDFDNAGDYMKARLYPLQSGMLKTCELETDIDSAEILHISGPDELISLFDSDMHKKYKLIEPMYCAGGCINGPAFPGDQNLFQKKQALLDYVSAQKTPNMVVTRPDVDTHTSFNFEEAVQFEEVNESQIQLVLERTGKGEPDQQLNCSACGYDTCREKAIAVVRGLADPETCLPYMRRLAQQRSDKIMETSPDGIVILDGDLRIIHMNSSFQKMFFTSNSILGRRISYLINADGFEKLLKGETDQAEAIRSKYGIKYHEIVYALRGENQYVGIFSNISQVKMDDAQVDLIRKQTMDHVRELLDHQISFSQQLAHFLGKNTAQSEDLVRQITDLFSGEKES